MTDPIVRPLTARDVAAHLKVSSSAICRWARAGMLTGEKTPRGWRFSAIDIRLFLKPGGVPLPIRIESRVTEVAAARGFSTIKALAKASGMHRSTIAAVWGRTPTIIFFSTLCRLCAALDVQPGELFVLVRQEIATDDND